MTTRIEKRLAQVLDAYERRRTGFPLGYEEETVIIEAARAALASPSPATAEPTRDQGGLDSWQTGRPFHAAPAGEEKWGPRTCGHVLAMHGPDGCLEPGCGCFNPNCPAPAEEEKGADPRIELKRLWVVLDPLRVSPGESLDNIARRVIREARVMRQERDEWQTKHSQAIRCEKCHQPEAATGTTTTLCCSCATGRAPASGGEGATP